MVGVNIGDLCTDSPWDPRRVRQALSGKGFDAVKFFHCDASKVIPIASSLDVKTIYIHATNDEMLTVTSWKHWVNRKVRPMIGRLRGKRVYLAVGNEVLAPYNIDKYSSKLLPAMRGCAKALRELSLGAVKVVTPLDTSCLQCSYPPSGGKFKTELVPILKQIITFAVNTASVLCFNIYPFFARQHASEAFSLFGDDPGYTDKGRRYTNLFDAQYDSVVHAVAKMGINRANRLEIVVTETGWPSSGEGVATPLNTSRYARGVFEASRNGTPMKPGGKSIFLFELYDENLKHGPEFEKHFGVFENGGREK